MRKLEQCLQIKDRINETQERIECLQSKLYSPKNQVITGMPHGGGGKSDNIYLIAKINDLKEKKARLNNDINLIWLEYQERMKKYNIKPEHIELIKQRFYYALSWNKCVKIMQEKYPNEKWNANKVFRIYRQIRYKFRRNE